MRVWPLDVVDAPAPVKRGLHGIVEVPGDKSVSHRSLMFGALCDGIVEISGLGSGGDNGSTARILKQLGVRIERDEDSGITRVHGVGLHGLAAPSEPLDCGNSGTTMRLMLGILAGQPFTVTLVGDDSLSQRPMARVLTPLAQMGLEVVEAREGTYAPLTIRGTRSLRGITYESPVASAQVKSAVLLAGLWADSETRVNEPALSRDHTERMLAYLGRPPRAKTLDVPGDLSSAAFMLGAALLVPGSRVTVRNVGVNPTRTGVLDAFEAMGIAVTRDNTSDLCGEPRADLTVAHGPMKPFVIGGSLAVRAIDELPLLAAIASQAKGTSEIRDAEELRVKESDRIAKTVALLNSFGIPAEERPDGMVVHGDPERVLRPGSIDAHGDHRIAMCAELLAMLAPPGSDIRGGESIASSFPSFHETLAALRTGTT